jgi:hypothetical protein
MEVELASTETYNCYNHEDNDWRVKEALAKARKARGEYTEDERKVIEERNLRMGVVEGENVSDLWIMGTD